MADEEYDRIFDMEEIVVGDQIYFMEMGRLEGPFRVVSKENARTSEHAILRNEKNGVLFEQYIPYTVWRKVDSENGKATSHKSFK